MQKVYIVMGQTGEYDSYSKWPVHAYLEREKAEEHVAKANERAKEIITLIRLAADDEESEIPELENEYDSGMYMDYNGTSYFVVDIPIQT